MKKLFAVIACLVLTFSLAACAHTLATPEAVQRGTESGEIGMVTGVAVRYENGMPMKNLCFNPDCLEADCDDWGCDDGTCTKPDCKNPACDGDDCLELEDRDVRTCTNPN